MTSQTIATVERALSLTKMYIVIAIFVSFLAITVWNFGTYITPSTASNSTNSSINISSATSPISIVSKHAKSDNITLLTVPFSVLPAIMLMTPVIILFVYDKNNGVLEYLLSLGMNQRDIYWRYLKASILITIVYFALYILLNLAYSYAVSGIAIVTLLVPVIILAFIIGVAVVTFTISLMMIFSSLQKSRAGGNQPLAITIGVACMAPGYIIPFLFSYNNALVVEVIEAVMLVIVATSLLVNSGKLIKREKFLP